MIPKHQHHRLTYPRSYGVNPRRSPYARLLVHYPSRRARLWRRLAPAIAYTTAYLLFVGVLGLAWYQLMVDMVGGR